MLVWVSKKHIDGGPNLDDDLTGWHVCKVEYNGKIGGSYKPCYWDARNDIIEIFYIDGIKFYKIIYEGLVTQKETECGNWYEYEMEALNGQK